MNRPPVIPAAPWQSPAPEVQTLANGLTVWHFNLPGQHITTFELVLPTPLTAEPDGKEGVATVALHAIDEGTTDHPDGEIGELLESQGANLHGTARHAYTTFGGQSPSRRLDAVLPLFEEVLTSPVYADADVAHHIEAQVAGYESKLASPGATNKMALRAELHGRNHRFGRPAAGTPDTVSQLTAADAHDWHRRVFTPSGATLIIAGDVPELPHLGWAAEGAAAEVASAPPIQPPRLIVVDQPGSVQATVAAACRTITRSDPRWPAVRLAGHAVAGAFASRLNLELRERLGYTYGVHGGFAAGATEGQFTVGGSFRSDIAADAVARLLDGISLSTDLTDGEIDDARRFLIDVAPLANETSADIVAQASALAAAGMDPDYLNRHLVDLASVSAGEATAAFRSVVSPEGVTVAITGDAASLLPALAEVGLPAEVVTL